MGRPHKEPGRKYNILEKLLNGVRMKQAAYEEGVTYSWVQKVKLDYPLFFWKTKKRYYKDM